MKVLSVEDNAINRKLLRVALEAEGIEVVEANDGVEALALLERETVDAVISDILMPNLDGYGLCHQLRSSEKLRDLPLILYSATYVSDTDGQLALEFGADRFIRKPCPTEVMLQALREVTAPRGRRPAMAMSPPEAAHTMKLYSERLVEKLEEKSEELRKTEEKYRSIFENAIMGIFQSTPEGRFLTVNPALASMLGYDSPAELVGALTDLERQLYVEPERRVEFKRLMEEHGSVSGFECAEYRRDRTVIWVSWNARAVRDERGSLLYYEGIVENITVRKQAEAQYRDIFDNAVLGIFRTTPDGRILAANPRLAQMWGYDSPEELMASIANVSQQLYVDPQQRDEFKRLLAQTGIATNFEHMLYRRDGSIMWGASNARAIRDEQGSVVYYDGTLEDITVRKRAEEKLRAKDEELRVTTQQLWQSAKLATMGEMAASIAHELNNPLATISLRLESLLEQTPEDNPQHRSLKIIAQETERMANLVSALLQFSRRSGQQISTIDLKDEIAGTLELVNYRLRNHRVEFAQEIAADLPPIHADRQQLRQVLLNLINNAIDAMREQGGGRLFIRASAIGGAEAPTGVAVEIADSGPGIPPDLLTRVMEPFFTTKAEGKGTGLGLAICKRIVEEHRGTLTIDSEVGVGTRITITLPSRNGANAEAVRNESDE